MGGGSSRDGAVPSGLASIFFIFKSLLAIGPMLFLTKFATILILDRPILSFAFALPSQVAPTSNSPPSFCEIRRQARRTACLGLNAQFNTIWLPSRCLGQNSLLVRFA
jgi:hypothetical protein